MFVRSLEDSAILCYILLRHIRATAKHLHPKPHLNFSKHIIQRLHNRHNQLISDLAYSIEPLVLYKEPVCAPTAFHLLKSARPTASVADHV